MLANQDGVAVGIGKGKASWPLFTPKDALRSPTQPTDARKPLAASTDICCRTIGDNRKEGIRSQGVRSWNGSGIYVAVY